MAEMTYNITLTANHQTLTAEYLPLAAESVQYLTAKVICETEDWTGCEIKAMFGQGCTVHGITVTGGEITAKQQLNLSAGDWRVWLVGNSARDGEVIPRITTNVAHISVAPTGGTEGNPFPTTPPTVEEQLRADMGNLADLATEDKSSLVAAINEAAASGGSEDAVTYTPQTLTEEQKSQARTNIGAVSDSDVNDKLPIYINMISADDNSNEVIAEDGTTGGQILDYLGSGREVVLVYQGFTYYLSEQGRMDGTTTLTSLSFAACAKNPSDVNPNGVNVLSRITYAFNKDNFAVTTEGRYIDPIDGIPKSDLADDVQTSLDKADAAISLGLTAATPGQIIKVKTVQNGKPTEWEAVDMPDVGSYTLPTASADTLGGVKVGDGLSIADGVLSASRSANGFEKISIIELTEAGLPVYILVPADKSEIYINATQMYAETSGTIAFSIGPQADNYSRSTILTFTCGTHNYGMSALIYLRALGEYNDYFNYVGQGVVSSNFSGTVAISSQGLSNIKSWRLSFGRGYIGITGAITMLGGTVEIWAK